MRLRLTETVEHLHAYVSAIYNQALKESLRSLEITPGRALLQCVDDLMICAPTEEYCEKDTVAQLKHLAAEGHKANLEKLQFRKRTSLIFRACDHSRGQIPLP